MSLLTAVKQAQDAASKAKPFMKIMDTLAALDVELRAAVQLMADVEAAAQRKVQIESEIPALQTRARELEQAINALQAQFTAKQAALDDSLAERQKAAVVAMEAQYAKLEAEHQAKIANLKNEITTLGGAVATLEKQRDDIQSQISQIRKTFEDAHAALTA